MNPSDIQRSQKKPPGLADALARYLDRQGELHAAGFTGTESDTEVVPYEAVPVQTSDARTAWAEALKALHCFKPQLDMKSVQIPEEWPDVVATLEPMFALPFAVGNYAQAVRNLNPLVQPGDHSLLRPTEAASEPSTSKKVIGSTSFPQVLVSLALLRLTRRYDDADDVLGVAKSKAASEWREALANEEGALAWHRGNVDEATAIWNSQPESVPVLFNRGMSLLFNGEGSKASTFLQRAVEQIPEDCGWHHLGKLYLAVAEMRSR